MNLPYRRIYVIKTHYLRTLAVNGDEHNMIISDKGFRITSVTSVKQLICLRIEARKCYSKWKANANFQTVSYIKC